MSTRVTFNEALDGNWEITVGDEAPRSVTADDVQRYIHAGLELYRREERCDEVWSVNRKRVHITPEGFSSFPVMLYVHTRDKTIYRASLLVDGCGLFIERGITKFTFEAFTDD